MNGQEALPGFDRPPDRTRRAPRPWLGLDRLRARVACLERRLADGAASERQMIRLSLLRKRLVQYEQEACRRWKRSFGS